MKRVEILFPSTLFAKLSYISFFIAAVCVKQDLHSFSKGHLRG